MSEGHDHTHETVNGTEPAPPNPIFVPPAEAMLADMRAEFGRVTVENFELRKAAEFQGQIIQMLQKQLGENMEELSRYKSSEESEPTPEEESVDV